MVLKTRKQKQEFDSAGPGPSPGMDVDGRTWTATAPYPDYITSHHITPHHITPTPSFRITFSDEEQEEIVFLQLTSIAFKGRAFSIEAELKTVGSAFVCLLFLSFYLPNLRSCMLMTPQKHFLRIYIFIAKQKSH